MDSIKNRINKLEKKAGVGVKNRNIQIVGCKAGESCEDALIRSGITEEDNTFIIFLVGVPGPDNIKGRCNGLQI